MASFSKIAISSAANGLQVLIVAIVTPGTLIHTAVAGSSDFDEIWLWAVNSDAAALKLTVEWGGVTVPNNLIEITIPAESGPVMVVPGWILQNGLIVRGFAGTTNLITIGGYVNRITA